MSDEIKNRVTGSKILSYDLEEVLRKDSDIVSFDLVDYLFQGLVLKEKDFRVALRDLDWEPYRGKYVRVHSSTDAILALWSFMLVASYQLTFCI